MPTLRELAAVTVGDRYSPVLAEGLRGDANADRRLAALVLGEIDKSHDPCNYLGVEAHLDQLACSVVALDVRLEDRVEHFVRGERLVVALVGSKLGRRRLGQYRLRDDLL